MNKSVRMQSWTLDAAQAHCLITGVGDPGPLAPEASPPRSGARPAILPSSLDTASLSWLCDPGIKIRVTMMTAANAQSLVAYGHKGRDSLVGFTPAAEGGYNLSLPMDTGHILALVTTGLGLEHEIGDLRMSAHVSGAALLALAGLVDALRQRQLESLLARMREPEGGVTSDEVYLRALDGIVTADSRWTATLMHALVDGLPELKTETVDAGLNDLRTAGLAVKSAGGTWRMAEEFALCGAHLQLPLAGAKISLERQQYGKVDAASLALFRMLGSLWLCRHEHDRYVFASVSAVSTVSQLNSILTGFVNARLADAKTAGPAKPAGTKTSGPAKAADAKTSPVANAANAKSGRAIEATGSSGHLPDHGRVQSKFCTHCGSRLQANAAYCTKCGTKIVGSTT